MTLAAPKSRRGKFTLALTLVAALVAAGGLFLWSNQAQAALPITTPELDQSPAGTTTVNPGASITYTGIATLSSAATAIYMTLEFTVDAALVGPATTCAEPAGTDAVFVDYSQTPPEYGCHWHEAAGMLAGTYTTDVTGTAPASGTVSPPSLATAAVCDDTDDNGDCSNNTGPTFYVALDDNSPTDLGILTVAGVSVSADATNLVGVAHTFTWTLPAGFTCESDPAFDDTLRSCDATDVVLGAGTTGATVTAGPTVSDANLTNGATVTVTISGSLPGSATVTLLTQFQDDDIAFVSTPDVTATKTYAMPGGLLRHWDVDQYSEDAAGNDDGILDNRDDDDDATGSFHRACILETGLTHAADAVNIDWNVVALGGAVTVSSATEVPGPDGEPCYRWGSNGTGAQQITATWSIGAPTPDVTFFWDGFCTEGDGCEDPTNSDNTPVPLELIKQWNDIDFTKIVIATGDIFDDEDPLAFDNTGELDNWSLRDSSYHSRANHDGETIDVQGVLIQGPDDFGHVDADGQSFIDYTFGDHSAAGGSYSGPIDGALQTYSYSGDCGSMILEDPSDLDGDDDLDEILTPGDSETVLSSDKGVAFTVVPNDEGNPETIPGQNADCDPSSVVTVTICTQEQFDFGSFPLDDAPCEEITIHWTVNPPGNKQPLLAWAGQRVVLEHDWSVTDSDGVRSCPWADDQNGTTFFVRYAKQKGGGALVSDLGDGVATGPDFMIVEVDDSDGQNWNNDCISRVIYEDQDQGENDIVAHVVDDDDDPSVISEQVAFVVYYMKLEDVKLGLVPGSRSGHNSGNFTHAGGGSSIFDATKDVAAMTGADAVNVSADVLARVRVRGWLTRSDCPARASGVDSNGGFLPANRCIFPDDWPFLAGGVLGLEFRDNYDIWGGGPCSTNNAGPFSLLDDVDCGGDSLAPHVGGGFRETNWPDGAINYLDGSMPSALVRLLLTGAGFIRPADKDLIYYSGNHNQYYVTHIPPEPSISVFNEDLTGYQWNTWGVGTKSGLYDFWTDLADHDAEVLSQPGDVPTGGYRNIKIYTDNHGEAMAFINGDANLTFNQCDSTAAGAAEHNVVLLNGYYCEQDDLVGSSTLIAAADYPDKRKHEPLASNSVTIEWLWGGFKEVTVEPGENAQFNYVVLHLKDRDGFCSPSPSLHPVIGERVDFLIDSPDGVIVDDNNGNPAAGPAVSNLSAKTATTHTFDEDNSVSIANGGITVLPLLVDGECQAWIHISSSLLAEVNVLVKAWDPEGTVTFDVIINPPPVPTPSVTPTAAPANKWGDIDCDKDVDSVDALGNLKYAAKLLVDQQGPCFTIGSNVKVGADTYKFGDWNCDGSVGAPDALAILVFIVSNPALPQTEPCPDVGAGVNITT